MGSELHIWAAVPAAHAFMMGLSREDTAWGGQEEGGSYGSPSSPTPPAMLEGELLQTLCASHTHTPPHLYLITWLLGESP